MSCFFVDKDRAIALIHENILREMLYLAQSRKFSPAKVFRYAVLKLIIAYANVVLMVQNYA